MVAPGSGVWVFESERVEVVGDASAGHVQPAGRCGFAAGPVDCLAEGIDLVVVSAVRKSCRFLDQARDPIVSVVAGRGVGVVSGQVDVAGLQRG